ncbi:MAG: hypothetical protein CL424_16670 [Acidimicrobiaceae bacterium]|nr:hypothetical protein [Acidimicrobiaceae bacterium]
MWTQSPEAALQIATGLHRERIARAEQLRLARASRKVTAPRFSRQPDLQLINRIGRAATVLLRRRTERGSTMSVPCPTGTC